jgi:hypothetical protein
MILWHVGLSMLIVWFVMRGNPRVDYRVVAVASLLPDLVDKPIGRIFFRTRFDSGRIYAHTLAFTLVLFCALFFMRGQAKRRYVLVPLSSLLHLAEDGVWAKPAIFWWPLFGAEFPREPVPGGVFAFLTPAQNAGALWQEAVGLGVLLWLFASHGMLSRSGLRTFLKTGMLVPKGEDAIP